MPRVFHTTPPQPASKARTTLYSLSVVGAEASQNGFGLVIPKKSVLRSAMGILLLTESRTRIVSRIPRAQRAIDGVCRQFTVAHRIHRQIQPTGATVAPGPDAGHRGAAFAVDGDAALLQRDGVAGGSGQIALPDRLKHHIRPQSQAFSRLERAALGMVYGKGHRADPALFAMNR